MTYNVFGGTFNLTQLQLTLESTSKSRATCLCRRIRSPLASVNSRLSSITEFMFSTHRASTSPSKTKYFRSFLSVGLLISRNMLDNSPSVQSLVFGSSTPYSSTTLRSFGLMVYNFVVSPNLRWQQRMNKWMSEWMSEWMNQSINQWMSQWMNESMNESVNDWMSQWMNESMNESVNDWMSQWMNQWINQSVNESMSEWLNHSMNQSVNESMNEWINEWINQWMTESMNESVNDWMSQWMIVWVSAWIKNECKSEQRHTWNDNSQLSHIASHHML